jgi:hypothetical protein
MTPRLLTMPTHDEEPDFLRDWASLSNEQHERFLKTVKKLVHDARAGGLYRKSLRIKHVQGHAGIYEMTWADDGRATFEFGTSPHAGDVHVIWRRIGSHDILKAP